MKKGSKVFGFIKQLGVGVFNGISPVTLNIKIDKNKDGKVDFQDLKSYSPIEIIAAVATFSALLYFEIINIDQLIKIINAVIGV